MKNLTINSTALRNLFSLAIIIVGLLLWVPQSWAATIHSTTAGGDWNKAETWVGGQVPGADDSVVVNGIVNVTSSTTIKNVVVSGSAILQSDATSADTLIVNGDITNNGIIKDTDEGAPFYIKVAGNITNNGQWKNSRTSIIDTQTRSIIGNPIQSSELKFASNLSIQNTSIAFANKVYFDSKLTLTFPNSNEIIFSGEVYFSNKVNFPNSAKITFLGKVSYVHNIIGENLTLVYGGSERQNIDSNVHNASQIILAGSGEKIVSSTTTINGSLNVEKNATLQSHATSSDTLIVNGDITNNGIIKDTDEGAPFYIKVAGNITNNGTWNNSRTSIIDTQTRSIIGNPIQSSELKFASNLSIQNTSIAFANKVYFDSKLTLTFPNSNEIIFSGEVYFSNKVNFPNSAKITFLGKVSYVHNIIGENLTLVYGGSERQNIDSNVHNASQIILAGSGEKIVSSTTTINGSLNVGKNATLQSHATSSDTLIVNGDITNNGIIKDTDEGAPFYIKVSGNILNNGTWNNSRTTLTFPSGEFRMTNTPTWEEPKRTSSYEITDYLNTQHHWQVSVDGVLSEQKGINDPSLVALPVVAEPEPTLPEPDAGATISGFVRTPEGQGVEEIEVCISNTAEQQCNWVNTDANGYFSLSSLTEGRYIVFPYSEEGQYTFNPGSQEILLSSNSPANSDFNALSNAVIPNLYVTTNRHIFTQEASDISVYMSMDVDGAAITDEFYDIYLVIGLADDNVLFQAENGSLTPDIVPYLRHVQITDKDNWTKQLEYVFTDVAMAGDYFVHIGALNSRSELVAEDHVSIIYAPNYEEYFLTPGEVRARQKMRNTRDAIDIVTNPFVTPVIDDLAEKLSQDGFSLFKKASIAFNVLNNFKEIKEVADFYIDLKSEVQNCRIDEAQRTELTAIRAMEVILGNFTLFNSIDLSDAIKEYVVRLNERRRVEASIIGAFTVNLWFSHNEWFDVSERTLDVTIESWYYMPLKSEESLGGKKSQGRYYSQLKEDNDLWSTQFQIDSKGSRAYHNGITFYNPGIYLLTAVDSTDGTIRRKTLLLERDGQDVKVGFDYKRKMKDVYSTSPDLNSINLSCIR